MNSAKTNYPHSLRIDGTRAKLHDRQQTDTHAPVDRRLDMLGTMVLQHCVGQLDALTSNPNQDRGIIAAPAAAAAGGGEGSPPLGTADVLRLMIARDAGALNRMFKICETLLLDQSLIKSIELNSDNYINLEFIVNADKQYNFVVGFSESVAGGASSDISECIDNLHIFCPIFLLLIAVVGCIAGIVYCIMLAGNAASRTPIVFKKYISFKVSEKNYVHQMSDDPKVIIGTTLRLMEAGFRHISAKMKAFRNIDRRLFLTLCDTCAGTINSQLPILIRSIPPDAALPVEQQEYDSYLYTEKNRIFNILHEYLNNEDLSTGLNKIRTLESFHNEAMRIQKLETARVDSAAIQKSAFEAAAMMPPASSRQAFYAAFKATFKKIGNSPVYIAVQRLVENDCTRMLLAQEPVEGRIINAMDQSVSGACCTIGVRCGLVQMNPIWLLWFNNEAMYCIPDSYEFLESNKKNAKIMTVLDKSFYIQLYKYLYPGDYEGVNKRDKIGYQITGEDLRLLVYPPDNENRIAGHPFQVPWGGGGVSLGRVGAIVGCLLVTVVASFFGG